MKKVTEGSINTEVIIEVAKGVEIAAMITKTSAEDMGIKKGKEVYAIIKASNVMVGVEH